MEKMIGILAVQGAFAEHADSLKKLGVNAIEIRQKADLTKNNLDGIILPGGESTVMGKLLHELNIFDVLKDSIANGLPVLGTCAGLILLSKTIINDRNIYLGTMDIAVKRNAYGRQLGSFQAEEEFTGIGKILMTFIRAPIIESTSKNVEILAKVNDRIVAAKQDNMIITSFHPELSADLSVHRYFLNLV